MQTKIATGIICYNPDLTRLNENIISLLQQSEQVLLIDNASTNSKQIQELLHSYSSGQKIKYFLNPQNYGIAYALNQLMYAAASLGYEWIITMDQDSVLLPGMHLKYTALTDVPKVAMITCQILERNSNFHSILPVSDIWNSIPQCITSGCCTKIKAILDTGGFDESYFIDYVDFDMCFRLRQNGYQILQFNVPGLLHSTGDMEELKFLGKPIRIGDHHLCIYHENPIRTYYFFRNTLFFWRKYGWKGRHSTNPFHIIWRAVLVLLFETPKIQKGKMIIKGLLDGWKKEIK